MAESTQDITIELETKGRNTIPIISPEGIITIHGNNGVGKSIGSTLLEIASGNYTFENEKRFKKLANAIDSCDITFKKGGLLFYKVILQPHIWRFDKNLNQVNPLTLGRFLKGEKQKEKDYKDFRNYFYIRTIRGNESLEQQIFFFKDIFVAKLENQLHKLERKLEYLENYEKWFENSAEGTIIDKYYELNEKLSEKLDHLSNLKNGISNRKATISNLKKKLELLEKLKFLSNYEIDDLKEKKERELNKINSIQTKISSNYEKISQFQTQLESLKNQFDEKAKEIIQKIEKLQKKRKKLAKNLQDQLSFDLEGLDEKHYKKRAGEIGGKISNNENQIKGAKEIVEKLNKKNQRIIKINKYLSQLRDICSRASSNEFGDEKLIRAELSNSEDLSFSFRELFDIFENNNLIFKQDKELKKYKKKVKEYNESIRKSRNNLKLLKDFRIVEEKLSMLERELKGKSSKLDNYLNIEKRIQSIEGQISARQKIIQRLENEIIQYKEILESLSKKIEVLKNYPSKNVIIKNLRDLGENIERSSQLGKVCIELIEKTELELGENNKILLKQESDLENTDAERKEIIIQLEPISQKIRKAAKKFGMSEKGAFIDYYKDHMEKLEPYITNTKDLFTRLNVLKDDISKVIEGKKPKNKKHLKIINEQFDNIFKDIYGREEFFEYVFKDYASIKKFDIANKSILFETPEGLEESRDLEEFSSGEKTYAYCRSIISMTANMARYNIVILDESYALLDREHSKNLYQFQEKMVKEKGITKFINILPLKEDLNGLIGVMQSNIKKESTIGNSENLQNLKSQLKILQSFQKEVAKRGYYQEIHYPKSRKKELNMNFGLIHSFYESTQDNEHIESENQEIPFSFILDGSNIARNNLNSKKASLRDVLRCKNKLLKLGVPERYIFIIFGSGLWHYIPNKDKQDFNLLLQDRNVNQAPAGQDDDWYIIRYAMDNNSYIITNDRYLEYRNRSNDFEDFIKSHSIQYNILGNNIQFEDGFDEKVKKLIKRNKIKTKIREI
ncbi:MAG: hypothetical protein GF311_04620 [Candidatus Lokiarchaeota archaeon]|nr:hypothetical protein [Candidatus Lokiarchaeota archaeon]